jgi:hypothetical protein
MAARRVIYINEPDGRELSLKFCQLRKQSLPTQKKINSQKTSILNPAY